MTGASGVTLLARILGNAGTPAVQSDFSGIAYTVQDLTTALAVVTSTALTVSSVIFNALQQSDPRWTADSKYTTGPDRRYGYNFAATLPATQFVSLFSTDATGLVTPHKVQVTVIFTPVAGQPFRQVAIFTPLPTW